MAAINQASEGKAIIFSKRLIDNNKDEDSNVEEQRTTDPNANIYQ